VCELRSVGLQSCPLACFSVSDVKHVGLLPGCQFSCLFCLLVCKLEFLLVNLSRNFQLEDLEGDGKILSNLTERVYEDGR
jgi:hypothetical protein